MNLPEEKVKFVIGLSNGESLTEGIGLLERIDGEPSPWNKLQEYIKDKDLEIRSMSLYTKTETGNRHYHLPNDKSKFGGKVPIAYNCFRKYAGDTLMGGSDYELYTCMEAIYKDCKVQLYVSEIDPDKCWINYVQHKDDKKKLQ